MMMDACTDGVVMMVMGKMILWQSRPAATFWENKSPSRALSGIKCVCPDGVSADGWWCLSCWCLGGLSIVFRWSLASRIVFRWSLASRWHFGGVSVSLDGVRWCLEPCSCFVVFLWCFGGVPVVFWWYWRNGIFLSKMVPPIIPNWRQRRCETLLLGLYAGLINLSVLLLYLFKPIYWFYVFNLSIFLSI